MILNTHKKIFNEKLKKGAEDECWPWEGTLDSCGYGKVGTGRFIAGAHRVSYELFKGEIPKGLHVRHSCDNPCCVNSKHLSLGTAKDNKKDSVDKNRHFSPVGETHGQAILTLENVKEIRNSNWSFAKGRELAFKFGVGFSTVYAVKLGNTWKGVL